MANGLDPSLEQFRNQDNLDQSKIKLHKKMAMKGIKNPKDYFNGTGRIMASANKA